MGPEGRAGDSGDYLRRAGESCGRGRWQWVRAQRPCTQRRVYANVVAVVVGLRSVALPSFCLRVVYFPTARTAPPRAQFMADSGDDL